MSPTLRTALLATLVAGTIDIVYAAIMASIGGGTPMAMLRTVASGPLGSEMRDAGTAGAAAGLAVHFAIMFAMAATFVLLARRVRVLTAQPVLAGVGYGLLLYLIMYWIVLPLRWPTVHPSLEPSTVASALFAHIVLVGLPIAWLTARRLRTINPA